MLEAEYVPRPWCGLKDMSMKNPGDPIGNRTHDPPFCSAAPQTIQFQHTGRHKEICESDDETQGLILSNLFHDANSMCRSHSKIFELIKVMCLFTNTDLPIFISFTMNQNRLPVKMFHQLQPNHAGTEHYVTRRYKSRNSRPLLSQW